MNLRRKFLSIGAGLAIGSGLGVLIIFGLGGWDARAGPARDSQNLYEKGSQAPDFTLEALDGEQVHLNDFRGKVVILNFWATWCIPCREEMPYLEERYRRYKPDLVVLAINFAEPTGVVKAYVEELGLTFDVLLDPRALVQGMYEVRGYPTSVFIDAQGMIQTQHIGAMTEKQLDDHLASAGLLPESGKKGAGLW